MLSLPNIRVARSHLVPGGGVVLAWSVWDSMVSMVGCHRIIGLKEIFRAI